MPDRRAFATAFLIAIPMLFFQRFVFDSLVWQQVGHGALSTILAFFYPCGLVDDVRFQYESPWTIVGIGWGILVDLCILSILRHWILRYYEHLGGQVNTAEKPGEPKVWEPLTVSMDDDQFDLKVGIAAPREQYTQALDALLHLAQNLRGTCQTEFFRYQEALQIIKHAELGDSEAVLWTKRLIDHALDPKRAPAPGPYSQSTKTA